MPGRGQDTFYAAAEAALSQHRLRLGFKELSSDTQVILLGRHLRNMALSEAFYPALQTLEIVLRNRIDTVLAGEFPESTYGQSWLSTGSVVLTEHDRDEVGKVQERLPVEPKEPTTHRILAGMTLGFWTNLLTRKYEISDASTYQPQPGRQTALWPRHLREVFPHLSKTYLTRDHVYKILSPVAKLRNAVFHHRPIWNEKLNTLHVSATEAIGWISPEMKRITVAMDRFPSVYQRPDTFYRTRLREISEADLCLKGVVSKS